MEHLLDHIEPLDSRQFMIAVKRLADSLSYGTDSSPFLGSGIEYMQSRQYQFGDPIKSIDWRVTARTGKLFVKEYESPKRLPCYLMIDTSASMTISSIKRSKYEIALQIGGGLAFACLDRVSPVGVIGVGTREFRVQPSLSKDQIMQWLVRLRRHRFDERTTLGRRIAELNPSLKSRALIIVLSDLHDPKALPALKRLNQQHDVVAVQLRDPAEDNLKGSGFIRGQEAESGRTFVSNGRKQWLDRETIAQELKRGGVDHLVIETHKPIAHTVRHFFESRNILTRGAR
jgi:uncharacterized protein (DUF58 family)